MLMIYLTTKSWKLFRAVAPLATIRASRTLFVHLASYEVSPRPVVAGVKSGIPTSIFVRGSSTSNLVSVRPNQSCVVTSGTAELERLDVLLAEESHLLIPVCDCLVPIICW